MIDIEQVVSFRIGVQKKVVRFMRSLLLQKADAVIDLVSYSFISSQE